MIPELFYNALCQTRPVGVLATVIASDGHGPARAGAALFRSKDGQITGTVGGGSNEQQVLAACAELDSGQRLLDIGPVVLAGSLPSCGGTLRLLLEWVDFSDPKDEQFWKTLEQILTGATPHTLVTIFSESDGDCSCQLLLSEAGGLAGRGEKCVAEPFGRDLQQQLLQQEDSQLRQLPSPWDHCSAFVQPLNRRGRLILLGAGHVVREVAWLAGRNGFQIMVVDPRVELMQGEQFPAASSLQIATAKQFFAENRVGERDFLVIAGPDHSSDLAALLLAAATPARYIGVMGSSRKISSFTAVLSKKNLQHLVAGRLYAPIGIAIGSKSPAEVAVSIVAELIQVRAQSSKKQ